MNQRNLITILAASLLVSSLVAGCSHSSDSNYTPGQLQQMKSGKAAQVTESQKAEMEAAMKKSMGRAPVPGAAK